MGGPQRYFELFVVPNLLVYVEAEKELTSAVKTIDPNRREAASKWALAAGMNAAVAAYHMADAVFVSPPVGIVKNGIRIDTIFRENIEKEHCKMLRTDAAADDLSLLGCIVDAYKHAELDDQKDVRPVTSNRQTVVTTIGYGGLGYGEGKYGGIDQVIVTLKGGKRRALSSILQNVIDMWRRVLGKDLPAFGQ